MRLLIRHALLALFAGCFGFSAFASEYDIAGLKLGMSPAQAKAALVAAGFDPKSFSENMATYSYNDGVNGHETEAFLDNIAAEKRENRSGGRVVDNFKLAFAPPPKGGYLVMIRRNISNPIDPPTVAEYRAALTDKYGKPDIEQTGSLMWLAPRGAVNCMQVGNNVASGSAPEGGVMDGVGSMMARKKITNPSQCASMLEYRMSAVLNGPARTVRAILTDVPGWAKAYLASQEWVEAQRQAAVKARESKASKPKL
ncbi:MAG: hypothetical protein KIS79_07325 [Burkholderiales bacterium]|nr:hypothetical protein [Burkholderiales bacterium]